MSRFAPIPNMPQGVEKDWNSLILESVLDRVRQLSGDDRSGGINAAILRSQITAAGLGRQRMMEVSATGAGFKVGGQQMASHADYNNLIRDVQTLANDLYYTREMLNLVIRELKGG